MPARFAFALAIAALLPAGAAAEDGSPVGFYDGGQTEVAAGLELSPDGRFEYALSYGALDEVASGTWSLEDGALVLTSDPVIAPAFVVTGTEPGRGRRLSIVLEAPSHLPVQLFSAFVGTADGEGIEVNFDRPHIDIPLGRATLPLSAVVALPIFDIVSPRFEIAAGTRTLRVRFDANDLGRIELDRQVLPREGEAFVLERHGRRMHFRRAPEEELPED